MTSDAPRPALGHHGPRPAPSSSGSGPDRHRRRRTAGNGEQRNLNRSALRCSSFFVHVPSGARSPRRRYPSPIAHGDATPPRTAKGNRAPGAARSRAQKVATTAPTLVQVRKATVEHGEDGEDAALPAASMVALSRAVMGAGLQAVICEASPLGRADVGRGGSRRQNPDRGGNVGEPLLRHSSERECAQPSHRPRRLK